MPRSRRRWMGSLVRRGLVVALTTLALALYGLTSAGTQSLALKPTASGNGGGTSGGLSVATAISPTTGSVNVAALGPNHSLRFYWQVGGTWYGPLGLGGANTTYSAPTIATESTGNMDILVEGPNHTLWTYWDASGTWYGPFQVGGPGSTFSTPSLTVESNDHLDVAALGPSNTLNVFWDSMGTWYGPNQISGPNTAFAAPSMLDSHYPGQYPSPSSSYGLHVFVQGRFNSLNAFFYLNSSQRWEQGQAASDNTSYSSQSPAGDYMVYMGPNNSLYQAYSFSTVKFGQIMGGGTTFSTPGMPLTGTAIGVEGPSNTLYYLYDQNQDCCDANYQGPLQLGAPGSTFSAPSLAQEGPLSYSCCPTQSASGTVDVLAQGPSNSLYAYWVTDGVLNGPIQVAGAGTTFTSST